MCDRAAKISCLVWLSEEKRRIGNYSEDARNKWKLSSEAHAVIEKHSEAHAVIEKHSEAHAVIEKHSEAHAVIEKHSEAHAVTEKHSEAHAVIEKHSEAHAVIEKHSEAHAVIEKHSEAHAANGKYLSPSQHSVSSHLSLLSEDNRLIPGPYTRVKRVYDSLKTLSQHYSPNPFITFPCSIVSEAPQLKRLFSNVQQLYYPAILCKHP